MYKAVERRGANYYKEEEGRFIQRQDKITENIPKRHITSCTAFLYYSDPIIQYEKVVKRLYFQIRRTNGNTSFPVGKSTQRLYDGPSVADGQKRPKRPTSPSFYMSAPPQNTTQSDESAGGGGGGGGGGFFVFMDTVEGPRAPAAIETTPKS